MQQLTQQAKKHIFTCYSSAKFSLAIAPQKPHKHVKVPEMLTEQEIIPINEIFTPKPISIDLLKQVHDPIYVDKFINGTMSDKELRRMGFSPWSEKIVERVFHTIGATKCAAYDALLNTTNKRSCNLAGGGHHSFYDKGGGYCVWNDIIIAGHSLLVDGLIRKYLVIDLDVHQGDGTASLAALHHDKQSFTFSMHNENNFPLRKEKSNLDVPLKDGIEDEEYLRILNENLKILEQELKGKIDIIFYQSGVDIMKGDRFGRLKVSLQGVKRRDEMVLDFAKTMGDIPIISMMGGGYFDEDKHPIELVCQAHVNTVDVMRNYKI
ncbi:hypothetical protein ABK040_002031 [Willaertia magna]